MTSRSWQLVRHLAAIVFLVASVVSPDLSGQGWRGRASVLVNGYEAVDGEVLVGFRDAAAAFEQTRAADDIEADEVESVGRRGTKRMHSRRMGTRELLARLRANPDIDFVEPNYIIRLDATPNDPSFGNLWGLFNSGQNYGGVGSAGADIDATFAWDVSTGSRANVVGVIDTGIDYNHPDLAANVWTAPSSFSVTIGGVVINCAAGTHGFNAITNTCDPMDDNNHGTHVAGTIGAVGNNGIGVTGINWTASIMALKFLDSTGSGTVANAIKAIEFAVQAKAVLGVPTANVRVLSNSWGGAGFSQSLLNEIGRANTADMLFVASAGNSGVNIDSAPTYPASYSAPNVVAVAATDNRDQRASFSNYGAATVHLGAPGVAILSTTSNNTYTAFSGTSMAAPHVSGAAALLLSACSFTTANLKAAIMAAVDPVPAMTGVTISGGRLNVNNAIRVCHPINPFPSLTSISPSSVNAGSTPPPTLTVSGSGFVPGSEVRVDGVPRATTFTSNAALTVTLQAQDVAGVTSHAITVVSPAPGGGTSNSLTLNVVTPPTSADGTLVPPAPQIVDAQGAVWTINGGAILRNGASAAGGSGVSMLWSAGAIYVQGSAGGNWWKWLGAGWVNVGPVQPGGVVTPPPPPSDTTSPDGTVVPPALQIVDAQGAVWTINGGAILRNGVQAAGGRGVSMLWSANTIYVHDSASGDWWKWLGAGWLDVGPVQPGDTVTPPPPSGTTSPDGTLVPPALQIVDAQGAVWTINGGAILRNGVSAAGGSGVSMLWSANAIYVHGSESGDWWKWLGAGWLDVGPAQPGGAVTPPPSGTTSPDGTLVPPALQIVDAQGAVWTINGGAILRNGVQAAGGRGVSMLWSANTIYVHESVSGDWWKWLGAGWVDVGPSQPGGTVTPPPPSGTTSPDRTLVPPALQIVDAQGAVWTMNGGAILRNGVQAAGGWGVSMLWSAGAIYVQESASGNWWKWLGAGWVNVGPAQP